MNLFSAVLSVLLLVSQGSAHGATPVSSAVTASPSSVQNSPVPTTVASEPANLAGSGASPQLAIGLSFFGMAAIILGSSTPLIFIYFRKLMGYSILIGASTQPLPDSFLAGSFAFAVGALSFGSLYHILPDACNSFLPSIGRFSQLATLASLLLGVLLYVCAELIIQKMAPGLSCPCHAASGSCSCTEKSCGCEEYRAIEAMKKTSLLALLAMTFHHIPEGIIFYVTATANLEAGAIIGLILLIHNFPEGIAIGSPTILAFPKQQWRCIVYGIVSGLGQPIGAIISFLAFRSSPPSDIGIAITFGVTAGMLLTICFRGMLPNAFKFDPKDRVTGICALLGGCTIFFSIAMFSIAGFAA